MGNTKVSSHVPKLGLDSAYVLWICWREFHAQVRVRSGGDGGVRGEWVCSKFVNYQGRNVSAPD